MKIHVVMYNAVGEARCVAAFRGLMQAEAFLAEVVAEVRRLAEFREACLGEMHAELVRRHGPFERIDYDDGVSLRVGGGLAWMALDDDPAQRFRDPEWKLDPPARRITTTIESLDPAAADEFGIDETAEYRVDVVELRDD